MSWKNLTVNLTVFLSNNVDLQFFSLLYHKKINIFGTVGQKKTFEYIILGLEKWP